MTGKLKQMNKLIEQIFHCSNCAVRSEFFWIIAYITISSIVAYVFIYLSIRNL